ncbi:MAG: hypothetical protein PHD04_03475 [Candidatus Pacebacteria bacterium]|nr:hypothetical protein [Candidatus Paceibacterota bacterium]
MTNEPLSDDEWITKNAQYLKDGFRKTKTFKAIIDGTIQGCKDKGDKDGLIEIYRPLFEELYLNGCVQGVHGQRIADKKQQKSSVARILNEIGDTSKKNKGLDDLDTSINHTSNIHNCKYPMYIEKDAYKSSKINDNPEISEEEARAILEDFDK